MKYGFDYDPGLNRITVTMRDFWTVETVREFAAASGAFAQQTRAVRADYDVLIDTTDFPVQANDVADLLPSIADAGLTLTSGRAASVVASHLNKLQAERTQTHPRFGVFMTRAEAEAWLATPPAAA
ncbi:hypothetical protein [Sphingomonas sp. G-3-2-10]|uniref:hypothetical protein n=1 Tax=Sphingomonas sp. G-3-2-10 TaxID=2728838 RepID=UPI00146F6B3C|nr:hypothetical protein [Sphingomonas sp. G-3-2-10]NML06203.1 hypothetical protein [Sphingomonas sp. G-3-2-10]